jgi:hypothetical protein
MKFIIDKNLPVPIHKSGLCVDMEETMKALQPEESFLVLFNKVRPHEAVIAAYHYVKKKMKDRKYTSETQKTPTGDPSGLRVWRLPIPVTKPAPQPPTQKTL